VKKYLLLTVRPDKTEDIKKFFSRFHLYLGSSLGNIFFTLYMTHGASSQWRRFRQLRLVVAIDSAVEMTEPLNVTYTPSLPIVHKHVLPFLMRKYNGFGKKLLEDFVEQNYQTMNMV